VGAHWVTDVLGGWALGATLGALAHFLALELSPRGYLAILREGRSRRSSWRVGQPPKGAAPNVPRGS
jgi:membrane-associated phospholipid phosphatase